MSCFDSVSRALVLVVLSSIGSVVGLTASAQENPDEKEKKLPTLSSLRLEFDVQRAAQKDPLPELGEKYEEQLKKLLGQVTQRGELEKALAVKAELEGYLDGKSNPAEAGFPELGRLQQIYSKATAERKAEMSKNLVPLAERHKADLADLQKRLTQRSKFEEALEVKAGMKKVDELLLQGREIPQEESQPVLPTATKSRPFENHLGMRFVPVPITGGPTDGKLIFFSIWETRVKDYEAFIKKDRTRDWPKPSYEQGDDHPAVNASWDDAVAFCKWLTEEGRKKGQLGKNMIYRLPTDHEWSCAVGIGEKEAADVSPSTKNGEIASVYPWGSTLPPPAEAGNFDSKDIDGFSDDFSFTAPAGSFEANEYGIHDLGGNVWEWCQDWFDPEKRDRRTLRGGSWFDSPEKYFRSSSRSYGLPDNRIRHGGFRCVLAQ